jgi:hypothetical protein
MKYLIQLIMFYSVCAHAKTENTSFELADEQCQTTSIKYFENKLKNTDDNIARYECKRKKNKFICNSFKISSGEDYGVYNFKIMEEFEKRLDLLDLENFYWISIDLANENFTAANPFKNPLNKEIMSRFCYGKIKSQKEKQKNLVEKNEVFKK